MTYGETPRRENKIALVVSLASFLAGMLLIWLAAAMPYPAIWQCVGVLLVAVAVWFLVRAQVTFRYEILPDARGYEGEDLVVRQIRGKKEVVVCRLGLADLCAVDSETPDTRKAVKQKYHGDRVNNYCVDVLPARALLLAFDDADTRVVIRLQPSAALTEILTRALEENGHGGGRPF